MSKTYLYPNIAKLVGGNKEAIEQLEHEYSSLVNFINNNLFLIKEKNFNDASGAKETKSYGAGTTKIVSRSVNFQENQFDGAKFEDLLGVVVYHNINSVDGTKYFVDGYNIMLNANPKLVQITIALINDGTTEKVNQVATNCKVKFYFRNRIGG